ncbi:AAA family ATPase [Streptomyces roseifaciens]
MHLFDRHKELEALSEAFADCVGGSGQLVIISGGPGSGKTGLLHEFADTVAAAGARLLIATASATERNRPLGTVGDLLLSGEVAADVLDRITRCRTSGETAPAPSGPEQEKCVARAVQDVSRAVVELAGDRPVVIGIDDCHHMDAASLRTVLALLQRIRTKRVLVVCTGWEQYGPAHPFFRTELLRRPHRRVRLAPLSEEGVGLMLAAQSERPLPPGARSRYHRMTAGNPMLVRALLDDTTRFGADVGEPVASVAYRQAVLACLARTEPGHARTAAALAALGDAASARSAAAVTGLSPDEVQQVAELLSQTGLLDGYRFRHAVAASAVLSSLAASERSRLHGEVAQLRYEVGDPLADVARHLLAAGRAPEPWGPAVLRRAAEQALAADDVEEAASFLGLALRECKDQRERHALSATLARAVWRVNPAAAGPHLAPLYAAARSGTLDTRDTATVLRHMLWQGDTDLAAETVSALSGLRTRTDARLLAEMEFVRQWFYGMPRALQRGDAGRTSPLEPTMADHTSSLWASVALMAGGTVTDESVTHVAEALQAHQLSDLRLELTTISLMVIAHADRPATAAEVCDSLLADAGRRESTTWQAVLGAVRAEIALLQGDVETASEKAVESLGLLHPQGWGVLAGLPLSTALFAYTARGRHEAAADLLQRKVPDSMFQTLFGVQYLRARGHHYLATGRAFAALNDFETCGQLMQDRSPELQAGIPWRTDLAQANLRIGKQRAAKDWAQKQLRLRGNFGSRTRAITLRVLAGASQLRHRTALLRESVDLLQACGDRLELALAYGELSAAHYELGEFARARLLAQQAAQEAAVCRIDSPVGNRLERAEPEGPGAAPALSDAECRVAALAALGYTNREISSRIHVTISTVEQHLTRVYRKLNVASRTELPSKVIEYRIPTPSDPAPAGRSAAVRGTA